MPTLSVETTPNLESATPKRGKPNPTHNRAARPRLVRLT